MEKNTTTDNGKNIFKHFELMGFCGFYHSIFDDESIYYMLMQECDFYMSEYGIEDIEIDKDITFDYKGYQKEVIELWAKKYAYRLDDIVKGISNVEMVSPKFYNFQTDRIFADVELVDNWKDILRDFIAANYNELQEQIHEEWSDRDGFWSFIDNDIDNWMQYLFDDDSFDDRYLEIMLRYYLESKENDPFNNIEEEVYEDAEYYNYINLSDELSNKVMEARAENC